MTRKRTLVVALVVLLLIIALVGSAILGGHRLQWEQVAFGEVAGYKGSSPMIRIVSTAAEASSVEYIKPNHLKAVESIDFGSYVVAVVYMGKQGAAGYSIKVSSVRLRGSTVTIDAKFLSPDPKYPFGQLITSPYYILKIRKPPKLSDEATFVLRVKWRKVAETTHLVPPSFTSPISK